MGVSTFNPLASLKAQYGAAATGGPNVPVGYVNPDAEALAQAQWAAFQAGQDPASVATGTITDPTNGGTVLVPAAAAMPTMPTGTGTAAGMAPTIPPTTTPPVTTTPVGTIPPQHYLPATAVNPALRSSAAALAPRTGAPATTQGLPITLPSIPGIGSIFNSDGSLNLASLGPVAASILGAVWNGTDVQGAYDTAAKDITAADTTAGNLVKSYSDQALANISNAGAEGANAITSAGEGGATNIESAAQTGISGVNGATGNANDLLAQELADRNAGLQPYETAGAGAVNTLASDLAPGGELNSNLTADQLLANDPGYQARLNLGNRQLEHQLAAEGKGNSGAELQQLERYGQDYASNEFSNAYQRFQQNQTNLYNRLSGVAGIGQNAQGQGIQVGEAFLSPQASNLMNAGMYNSQTGLSAATSAGQLGLSAATSAGNLDVNALNAANAFGMSGAEYSGNTTMASGNAQAGSVLGAAAAKQAMITTIMNTLGQALSKPQTTINNSATGGSGTGGSGGAGGAGGTGGATTQTTTNTQTQNGSGQSQGSTTSTGGGGSSTGTGASSTANGTANSNIHFDGQLSPDGTMVWSTAAGGWVPANGGGGNGAGTSTANGSATSTTHFDGQVSPDGSMVWSAAQGGWVPISAGVGTTGGGAGGNNGAGSGGGGNGSGAGSGGSTIIDANGNVIDSTTGQIIGNIYDLPTGAQTVTPDLPPDFSGDPSAFPEDQLLAQRRQNYYSYFSKGKAA